MSKQSDAKKEQGYVPKAIPAVCGNCVNFKSERVMPKWRTTDNETNRKMWERDGNFRCGIGGFAVKKMGACRIHRFAEQLAGSTEKVR